MPKLIFKKRVVPEEGRWLCTLMRVEEEENKFYDPRKDKPDKAKRLGWIFSYDEKPETEIRVWSSPSLSVFKGRKSRALEVVETLLDKALSDADKEKFEGTDTLVGKKCQLNVKHEKSAEGDVFAKVESLESLSGKHFNVGAQGTFS